MGEIVNLKQARKALTRDEAAAEAAANRAKFGRSKSEKQLSTREVEQAERALDGKQIDLDE